MLATSQLKHSLYMTTSNFQSINLVKGLHTANYIHVHVHVHVLNECCSHSDGDKKGMQTNFFLLVFQQRQAVFNQAVSNDSQSNQEQRVNIKINTSSVSLSLRYI